jgi:hypothetical protein
VTLSLRYETDLRNSETVCKVCFFFHVRPETFGLDSRLNHSGTYTPRRLLCVPRSPHLFGHLKRLRNVSRRVPRSHPFCPRIGADRFRRGHSHLF